MIYYIFFMVFICVNTRKLKIIFIFYSKYTKSIRTKRGWTYFIKYFDIPSSIFENCALSNLKVSVKP